MGSDARGRRHASAAWLDMITDKSATARGRKLVVQVVETFHKGGEPGDRRYAWTLSRSARKAACPIAPVMIYGDDVTHVVTEEGIAYLYKTTAWRNARRPSRPLPAPREVGLRADQKRTAELRSRGIVATPEDLGVRRTDARRSLLAAHSIDDLVAWSGGLYRPPAKFRSW